VAGGVLLGVGKGLEVGAGVGKKNGVGSKKGLFGSWWLLRPVGESSQSGKLAWARPPMPNKHSIAKQRFAVKKFLNRFPADKGLLTPTFSMLTAPLTSCFFS
jgi:hypothetical protein